ncbi:CMRF35-like molecule 1 isoform X9 [Carassius gibelio]|uniref:CMRF35-like molecule 1 isoform X9 n=1 Tax=Carassius gibelio TaxID=101364 RepID=UPI00227759F6|nr:CMRF35-like molecule 1 isoform X9 [Carassius gibelio]
MKLTFMISAFLLTVSSSVPVEIFVRGTEGEQVFLNCPYAEGYENSGKYFYKGPTRERNLLLKSAGGQSSVSEGRFSLLDDHQKRSFTLTIRNLSLSDAGVYSCGAGWNGVYKNIQLNVIRAPQKTRPDQISTSTLQSYTHTSTVTPRTGRETTRTMTGSTAVQLDQLKVKTATGSFVIIITAAMVLLLIGLPLIIVTVWKKEKNKGLLSSSIVEFNQVIHEHIKHAGRHCNPEDRDTETTVVYSCVS